MASIDIDLLINTANSANSLKDVKTQLKAIKNAMIEAGEGTAEFNRLAAAAAELGDKVDDVNQRIKGFNPDGFQALTNFASKAAGAVSAVTGAMALFGDQSEDVQKALVKVQGALALTQGLDAIKGLGGAFNDMKAVAVKAFQSIKASIGATGIGLILIAVGALYAYWDDIKAAVSGVSDEQKKLLADTKATAAAAQANLDAVSKQENILKLNGASEKDILNLKIAQTDETITALDAQLSQQEQMKVAQVEAATRNRDILQGIIKFVSLPITLLLDGVDLLTEKLHDWGVISDETFANIGGLSDKFTGGVAELIFDPEQVAADGDKAIEETKAKLQELKNNRAGFQLQINEINKEAVKNEQQTTDALLDEIEKRRRAAESAKDAQEQADFDEWKHQRELQAQKILDHKKYVDEKHRLEQEAHDKKKALTKEEEEHDKLVMAARLDALSNLFGSLSSLAGKNAKLQKAFAVGEATINTYKGVTNALAQPLPVPINLVNAAAILAAGIANVRKILSVSTNGGGGGSGASGGGSLGAFGGVSAINNAPAQPEVPQPSTQLNPDGSVAGQSQPMRVYVLESDITERQNRVAVAESAVSFR